ncbi:hypothetical protein G6F65_018236 [Rhizopus arrhizus]|nr:hypothetical protein G6F65_018236 [Rhizopus arrhizus]
MMRRFSLRSPPTPDHTHAGFQRTRALRVDDHVVVEADAILAGAAVPVIELEVRLPAVVGQLVIASQAQADAAGPGVVVVEAHARYRIATVIQRGALPEHLYLRLQPPGRLAELQQRLAGLHRHTGVIALDAEAQPARGTHATVVTALHRHRIDVATGAAGECPVQAHVFVIQAVLAHLHVLPAQRQAGGLALCAAHTSRPACRPITSPSNPGCASPFQ